jgi:hypothetical protein
LKAAVTQQMLEHAPREGAVRTPALQRQIDALGDERRRAIRCASRHQRGERIFHGGV